MKETKSLLTQDGESILIDHYKNGFSTVLILAHGFYNSKQAILFRQMAHRLGKFHDVIVLDFRGHGKSTGRFTWTAKEPLDLSAVLDYAKSEYQKVGVVGFSLGAAISLIVASQTSAIDSLVVVSPPTSFWKIEIHFWDMDISENIIYNFFQEGKIGKGVRPGWLWHQKIKPIDIMGQVETPILFIHGQQDWLIRPWHSKALYHKALQKKKIFIYPQASHAEFIFRKERADFIHRISSWFSATL